MKRRSFLATLFAAPILPGVGAILTNIGDGVRDRAIARHKPVVIESADLSLRSANIGQVTAGVIRTRDGKMVLDLTNGVMTLNG